MAALAVFPGRNLAVVGREETVAFVRNALQHHHAETGEEAPRMYEERIEGYIPREGPRRTVTQIELKAVYG